MKYWHGKGKYSKVFDKVWDEHVPTSGECSEPDAELVRCFSRIVYDLGNNGGGNLFEGWGDDYSYDDCELSEMGAEFYNRLENALGFGVSSDSLYEVKHYVTGGMSSHCFENHLTCTEKLGDVLGDYLVSKGFIGEING